jgi:hypothetical protein
MKRLASLFCTALLCTALSGCAYDYCGPAVGSSVAVSSTGVYAGSVSVGTGYYATPYVVPVLPPLWVPPPRHHHHYARPLPPRHHGPAILPGRTDQPCAQATSPAIALLPCALHSARRIGALPFAPPIPQDPALHRSSPEASATDRAADTAAPAIADLSESPFSLCGKRAFFCIPASLSQKCPQK